MEDAALSNPRQDLDDLTKLEEKLYAHRYAKIQMELFGPSLDPAAATQDRAEALAALEEMDLDLLCSDKTKALLARLDEVEGLLTDKQKAQVKILKRDIEQVEGVDAELLGAHTRLVAESDHVWRAAKSADDWQSFEPYLDKVVASTKAIAEAKKPGEDPYSTLLAENEYGATKDFYDDFFATLKASVVPLFAAIKEKNYQPSRTVVEGKFDHRRQLELSHDLMALEGLDADKVLLAETEHPYCDSLSINYGFIATHIYEQDLLSNVYSILHEGGHCLYELGLKPEFNRTSLKGGTSFGMHEAQSRFFENIVGRSRAFMPHILQLLAKHFPGQMGRVTANQLYAAANRAVAGPIRTEADELTYPLHILIRYELEQLLFSGECTAKDIPGLWAQKYKDYLGIDIKTDREGALQDTHWADGLFGYFPTYALGSAYGAQLKHAMIEQGMDFDGVLATGDLEPVRAWLKDKVWQYGRAKDPADIMLDATGEAFKADYFCQYLNEKFSALYSL